MVRYSISIVILNDQLPPLFTANERTTRNPGTLEMLAARNVSRYRLFFGRDASQPSALIWPSQESRTPTRPDVAREVRKHSGDSRLSDSRVASDPRHSRAGGRTDGRTDVRACATRHVELQRSAVARQQPSHGRVGDWLRDLGIGPSPRNDYR